MLELILGILGNLISEDLRSVLEQVKYRRRLSKRIGELEVYANRTNGNDGLALLSQAVGCLHDAKLDRNVFIKAGLVAESVFHHLRKARCYKGLVDSMGASERTQFDELCLQVLGFICEELIYLPSAHAEIAAETLHVVKEVEGKLDVLISSTAESQSSEDDRIRAEHHARDFLKHIRELMDLLENRKALEVVDQLKDWLPAHEARVNPSILSEICEQLTSAEITRAKIEARHGGTADMAVAIGFLRKAKAVQLDEFGKISDNLISLEAYIVSFEEGADAGLRRLEDRTDPDSIRRKLLILRDAGRISEAATFIWKRTPEQRWCDQAVFVLACSGDIEKAGKILEWAESVDDAVVRRRCVLSYAEGLYTYALRNRQNAQPTLPGELTSDERSELQAVTDALQPVTAAVYANRRIGCELEYMAASIALHASYLLGDHVGSNKLAQYISAYRPGAYELGQLALRKWIDAPADLPQRLREDYPGSFQVGVTAAVIEGEILGRYADAFDAATQLMNEASTAEERKEIVALLHQIAQCLGPKELSKVKRIAPQVLKDDDCFLQLLEADWMLRKGETDSAKDILERVRDEDDIYWLQIYANCLLQEGDSASATDFLVRAVSLLPDPDLLRKTAAVAYRSDRIEDAIESLRRLVLLEPGDVVARGRLASLLLDKHDYAAAAEQFAVLREREPDEPVHAMNEAVSLMYAGDGKSALDAYNRACDYAKPLVRAFVGRAQVLKSLGMIPEAFDSLISAKDRFWDEPAFLMQLQESAFAANQDAVGHEAFMRLKQLQDEDRAPAGILRTMSVDEVVEDMKAWKKHDDETHEKVIRGHLPWLLADRLSGSVPYWGWVVRTQPMDYIYEDPLNGERHSIYSTNGFSVRLDEDGESSLEPLECSQPGSGVVADLSSLITLHRLDLLGMAAEYFGKVYIPAPYLSEVLSDSSRLVLHQLSQKTSLEEIKAALDENRIHLLEGKRKRKAVPYVHEHTMDEDKGRHYYRITDLLSTLRDEGLISDPERGQMLAVAHKPSGVDGHHPRLDSNQTILVELSTLKTLSSVGVLDLILRAFSVCIVPEDKVEVVMSLKSIASQEGVREWHWDLWDTIRKDARFVQAMYTVPSEIKKHRSGSNSVSEIDLSIASCVLADEMNLPLLVDDRILQNHALNRRRDNPCAAFGTSDLLVALAQEGMISQRECAEYVSKLIGWRYRFIIPPVQVLKTMASGFTASLSGIPGQPLREVACYVQDCMQDAGLFAGLEPTSPPTSMALNLFRTWIDNAVGFVIGMWADAQTDAKVVRAFTSWAMSELLPSLPQSIPEPQRSRLASLVCRMIFSRAILESRRIADVQRSNECLTAIARAFGLNEQEYLDIVTGVINDIRV